MKKRTSFYILTIFIVAIFTSCKSNRLDVRLDNPEVTIEFINVDQKFANKSLEEIKNDYAKLEDKLGNLFVYELSNNVRMNVDNSNLEEVFYFYNSEYIVDLEEEKSKLYSELPRHEEAINSGFRYLSYHFNDVVIPKEIFYINKLFSQINCSDENISIGLESYISPESEVIKSIPSEEFYQWQKDRMDIDYLERDVLMAWIQVHLFKEMDGKLAEHFIQAGKILYVLNACFPKSKPEYILRYTKEQYDWAERYEADVWGYLVSEQMLFETDVLFKTNYLNEGPTTIGLADGAPDRMGQFLGYKIVKGFMNKNKSLSLQELLLTDYNRILQTYKID